MSCTRLSKFLNSWEAMRIPRLPKVMAWLYNARNDFDRQPEDNLHVDPLGELSAQIIRKKVHLYLMRRAAEIEQAELSQGTCMEH